MVQVPKGYSIHLMFDDTFDIEKHYEEGCVYDYLTVRTVIFLNGLCLIRWKSLKNEIIEIRYTIT